MFIRQTPQANRYEFICDSADDIKELPTLTKGSDIYLPAAVGSTAFVIETSECYMLGYDNEWHSI